MNAPAPGATLADWLAYQERLHPRDIELGLDRVRAVAERLSLLPARVPTLTVAGTNGKGSSATLAALACREAGYRTGLYTSPHLLRYNERVAIDGVDADDDALCAAFAAIERVRGVVPLTYFEYGTLAALWLFRDRAVDVQVLEVGLGGRLDAVNIVDADAALVTSIGIDHTDWLGPDRESIGLEKAHVFRAHRLAVCTDRDPPAAIARHAAAVGAHLLQIGRDFDVEPGAHEWTWRSTDTVMTGLPSPGLAGEEQLRNAAGVIALLRGLPPACAVGEAAIRRALPRLALRGRYERRGNTILDVAHNAEAAAALAGKLARDLHGLRVELVLGMFADKPVEAFVRTLAPHVHGLFAGGLPPPRGLTGATLLARAQAAGTPGSAYDDVDAALRAARQAAGAGGLLLVTGSFLTVAAGCADE